MTTANEVITGAMRSLQLIAADETMSAEDASAALDMLNQMLHGWALKGVNLEHNDVALGDTLPVPADHIYAIRYALALDLAPMFEAPIPPAVAANAQDSWRMLVARYTQPPKLRAPTFWHPYYNPRRGGEH